MNKAHLNIVIIAICALMGVCGPLHAKMNNPFVDERTWHYGYFLSIDFPAYGIAPHYAFSDSISPSTGWGISVGWMADYRINNYLSVRFSPSLSFEQRNLVGRTIDEFGNIYGAGIKFKDKDGNVIERENKMITVGTVPISLPIHLKWSAFREKNFRPYVMIGAGMSFDFWVKKHIPFMPFHPNCFDVFADVGLGCDFYFPWFKLCPEIRYRIGFINMNTSEKYRKGLDWEPEYGTATVGVSKEDPYYHEGFLDMGDYKRLFNQKISLIFYFE